MKSEELEREIEALLKRKAKFQDGLNQARADLREAQADLIDGNDAASEAATLAQASVTSLVGTLDFLNDRIETKREKLAEAIESERVAAVRKEMTQCRAAASALIEELAETRKTLMAQYDDALEIFRRKGAELDVHIRRFRKLAGTIGEDDRITVPPDNAWQGHPVAATAINQLKHEAYRERLSRGNKRLLNSHG